MDEVFEFLQLEYLEDMFDQYLQDPEGVPEDMRRFFDGLGGKEDRIRWIKQVAKREAQAQAEWAGGAGSWAHDLGSLRLQDRVDQLIRAYRVRGHLIANLDPLGRERPRPKELDLDFYGLTEKDLDRVFSTRTIYPHQSLTLREIVAHMENTYCRSIGVQFMHIDDLSIKQWLQEQMEGTENRIALSRAEQLRILTRLTDAVMFEEFIHKKYQGAKSFSLEGAETLVPLLDMVIERAGEQRIDEIVIGMAHRGRLCVLATIMGKSPRLIFQEFEDAISDPEHGPGDVKYHLGYSTNVRTSIGHDIHLSLCFNPSHLEFVSPVAIGRMRAKMDAFQDKERRRGLCVLIHGDASFAGEGIVQETLNLSALKGYSVGGTLHIIVNNQIGFTTDPEDARSCTYSSDVAKMLQVPIFHVNGEDPEAVAQVVKLAMDFRRLFKRDVIIDLFCYRKYGHNETDDPSFTQPLMAKAIAKKEGVRESYLRHLLALSQVTLEEAEEIKERRRRWLEIELSAGKKGGFVAVSKPKGVWAGYVGGSEEGVEDVDTSVPKDKLVRYLEAITKLPEGFHPHPRILRFLDERKAMAKGERRIDFGTAEALAMASLADMGFRVRMSGQDSERGTFSHRHAVLHDYEDGRTYCPLQQISPNQAPVEIYNSPLSEAGVLGFEYGYSLDYPDALVIWEAQYGDFANVAQVYIDQFIASAEEKWKRLSGIVLFLPHGYEGQGPEHSSARLERFLALCANDNIQIVVPTTPAQLFHVLRRQVLRKWRKPLVVFTPKSLLRSKEASSSLDELSEGRFMRIIPDQKKKASKVLLCCGKIYYDLAQYRAKIGRDDVAIIRIEQLYPLKDEVLMKAFEGVGEDAEVVWVQEEPVNMGVSCYLRRRFGTKILDKWSYNIIGRPEAAAPAKGSLAVHKLEQEEIVRKAFS